MNKLILEEYGFKNLRSIIKKYPSKKCEIYFHIDLDGVTSAIAIKSFFKTYYDFDCIDAHGIQYGGLEFAVNRPKEDVMPILVDFAHTKPIFKISTDHHDKQTGVGILDEPDESQEERAYHFKISKSNVETISGEISYSDIFPSGDIELIQTVDSANFLKYDIKPSDVQNYIFSINRDISGSKNRFMMGFIVNRLILAYKNKYINVISKDGKRKYERKNLLECLVLDSNPSLISIFNNIKYYINNATTNDKLGVLSSPEEMQKNLLNYIEKMKDYKIKEVEYDPNDSEKKEKIVKTKKGVYYDKEFRTILQYGGGNMVLPGSYDRYVPFKNFPDALFLIIIWPMGLIQASGNPFNKERIKDIHMGDISKRVLENHKNKLKKIIINLYEIKLEYEKSQEWEKIKKMKDNLTPLGFRFTDLLSTYDDCILYNYSLVDLRDQKFSQLKTIMNKHIEELKQDEIQYLKNFKISLYDIIVKNSGGHKGITNISGLSFCKYNTKKLEQLYNISTYTDLMKKIARDYYEELKKEIKMYKNNLQIDTSSIPDDDDDLIFNEKYKIIKIKDLLN